MSQPLNQAIHSSELEIAEFMEALRVRAISVNLQGRSIYEDVSRR